MNNNSIRDNDSHYMLPPSRILIQGSEEYQAALESGALELSLPSNGYTPPRTPLTASNLTNVGNRTPPGTSLTRVVSPLERASEDASMDSSLEEELLDSTSDGTEYTTNANHLVSSQHSIMNGFDSISSSEDNVDMVVDRDIASLHSPEENASVSRDHRARTPRNHLEQTRFADILVTQMQTHGRITVTAFTRGGCFYLYWVAGLAPHFPTVHGCGLVRVM
jgi:hypothetical protein